LIRHLNREPNFLKKILRKNRTHKLFGLKSNNFSLILLSSYNTGFSFSAKSGGSAGSIEGGAEACVLHPFAGWQVPSESGTMWIRLRNVLKPKTLA